MVIHRYVDNYLLIPFLRLSYPIIQDRLIECG